MPQDAKVSTLIEFSRTLTDTKANFTVTVSIKIGEEGVTIGHEFGKSNGMCHSSSQGEITTSSLRNLLEACRHEDLDGLEVQVMVQAYDEEKRAMIDQVDDLTISFNEPLNFRPFLLQFLPIVIKTAELLDKSALPQMTSAAAAKC
jgi:hypothetical protein